MAALYLGWQKNLGVGLTPIGDTNATPYRTSKLAIEGLTKAFAKELPQGMITIALSPLLVLTDLLEHYKALLLPGEYELGVTPS